MASYKTTLTSTLTHPVVLCYRMPREETDSRGINPVLEVPLAARALNVEVSFASEVHYHHFKLQNEGMFVSGKIIEGKATEAQAVAVNAKNAKEASSSSRDKVEKAMENIQEASEERVTFEIEKDETPTTKRRKK